MPSSKKSIQIYPDDELFSRIVAIAQEEERSINQTVLRLLRAAVSKSEV